MRTLVLHILASLTLICSTIVAQESTATLDFDNAPTNLDCGSAWVEETFSLLATNHSQGGCSVGNFDGEKVIGAGQIRVDLSGRVVSQIELDTIDFCGNGCTSAFFTQNGNTLATLENQLVSEPETLTFDGAELATATDLRIQSFEAAVVQIRITYSEVGPAGPVLEIIPDPAAGPATPNAYVLCWTDSFGTQLERSLDLQIWEIVPAAEISVTGAKASYSVTQTIADSPVTVGRFFYRLVADDIGIPE